MTNDPVTPIPSDGTTRDKAVARIDETDPYVMMDRRDEEIIVESIISAKVDSFVYKYEINTKDGPRIVSDISIGGVSMLQQLMGGIKSYVSECRLERNQNHKLTWRAVAIAEDIFTGVSTDGHAECECEYPRGGQKAYAREIAISKAKRNAIKLLLPQDIRKYMADLGEKDINTFDKETVQRKFAPFWKSRNRLKERHFQAVCALQSGEQPGPIIEAQTHILNDSQPTGAIPETTGAPPPGNDSDRFSKKQYGYLLGLLKKAEYSEDYAKSYIQKCIKDKHDAKAFIDGYKEADDKAAYCEEYLFNNGDQPETEES